MEVKQTGVIALLDEACFLVGTVTDKVGGAGYHSEVRYMHEFMRTLFCR